MPKLERVREVWSGPLDLEYFRRKSEEGWRLAATEWVREAAAAGPDAGAYQEVPYGLKVSTDCLHLEENPTEREALTLMMELIIDDNSLSRVAHELNRRGFRTRQGTEWSATAIFNLIPRLVETGPDIFVSPEWVARKARAS